MPDGQEKSDDLIAELARLMASGASASEPEAKPGPKLVSVPEAPATPVRVPGSAAPAAEPARSASPAPASPPPAVEPPRAAPVIRIPGMDQPVPSSRAVEPTPAPAATQPQSPAVTPAPQPAPAVEPPATPRPSSVDFGPPPAADPIRQEPLVSFRMPEAPKSVQSAPPDLRPSYSPVPPPAASPSQSPAAAPTESAPPTAEAPRFEAPKQTAQQAPAPAVAPRTADTPVGTARPQPAGDAFDFDFGFNGDVPDAAPEVRSEPTATRSEPAVAPPQSAAQRQSSGDLIADLIAAELDANELGEPAPVSVFSPAPSRPVPAPAVATPPPASPMPRATPTAPTFGGTANAPERPAPAAPRPAAAPTPAVEVERDPIDEIESLIGEAVRVELGNDRPSAASPAPVSAAMAPQSRVEPRAATPVPPPAQAAPVVPPLTTGFAPRRAALKETEINFSSAEAAIRAAAAAAESRVGADAEAPVKRPRAHREERGLLSGGMRQYLGMAVAGTLLLAAGFGLYWVLGMGGGSDGDVPVLQADTTPAKQPAPATPATTDTQGNVVFSEIDGSSTAEGEQLVSRDDSADTPIADVARTVGDEGEGVSESELANRKVRTVTVRPDGTIVSGDEAVAGNEALPVDRPNVPDLPGADVQPSELLATLPTNDASPTSAATPAADASGALAAVAPDAATATSGEPVVPGSTVTTASGATAPIPMPAPNRQALASRVAAAPAATQAPAAPAAAPVAVSSGGSGAYAQLSSQPTEADARAALARLQSRVNGATLEIRQVDLGAKGVWYRVVLPTGSFQEATQVCATIKANGSDCLPING